MSVDQLAAALTSLAEDLHRSSGVKVYVDLDFPAIGDRTALALYLLVHHAVKDTVSNAHPSTVWISGHDADGDHVLVIREDGVGRDLQRTSVVEQMDLLMTRERARALFGTCSIGSSPSSGTTIIMRLPIWADTASFGRGPDDPGHTG